MDMFAHETEIPLTRYSQSTDDEWVTFNAKLRPEMAAALDIEANALGISRMALIRVVLARHIQDNG